MDSSQYTNSTTPAGFRSYEEFHGGIEARARGRRGFRKSRARVSPRTPDIEFDFAIVG